jgi:glycerol-3-phosphate acyltransferase PlsX
MNGRIPRIAVDAMGGDHAPEEIVAGALLAAREGLGRMLLVGDEARMRPLLPGTRGAIEVVHAPGAIAMDANPSQALRNADETRFGVAVNLVRDGRADAVVSAGNSGAFLAIALVRLRTIAGVARPAIAVVYPGEERARRRARLAARTSTAAPSGWHSSASWAAPTRAPCSASTIRRSPSSRSARSA